MAFIILVVGLLLSALGAVLLLIGGGSAAAAGDEAAQRRARWRSWQGMVALGLGIVLLIVGGVWLPYRNHQSGIGASVLLLIALQILSLMLNAIGFVLIVVGGAVLTAPDTLDEAWLARVHRHTRIGVGALFIGILAQLGAVSIFAL